MLEGQKAGELQSMKLAYKLMKERRLLEAAEARYAEYVARLGTAEAALVETRRKITELQAPVTEKEAPPPEPVKAAEPAAAAVRHHSSPRRMRGCVRARAVPAPPPTERALTHAAAAGVCGRRSQAHGDLRARGARLPTVMSRPRPPTNADFQAVVLPGSPGYARYPSVRVPPAE